MSSQHVQLKFALLWLTCIGFHARQELQAQLVREDAELAEASSSLATLTTDKAEAEEAVRLADHEKSDAAWYEKQAEHHAQAMRCGGNPSKDDEAAEKAALAELKKCKQYHIQTSKVQVARSKNLSEVSAEFETSQRLVQQFTQRAAGGGMLFAKHAKPFFEWLAADDDEEEEDVEVN
jgi:multidrug efflux pump subunit AcrA (membrane-fusion protein)